MSARDAFLARLKRPLARLVNRQNDWYRIQAKADGGPTDIYIYDEIGYWGDSAKDFVNALGGVDSGELTVHLNSPGGDIFDGLAIYQAIKDHPAQVTVKVDGLAASIASVIAMAGDKVIMAPKASMMIHDGWTMTVGNAKELRSTADLLDKQSDIIASVYADRSGQPADFWRDRMATDTWYNADEALAAGLVDEIEGREKPSEPEPFDLTVFSHAGREHAPDPVLKPVATTEPDPGPLPKPPETPGGPKEDDPAPFVWNWAEVKAALQEGVK